MFNGFKFIIGALTGALVWFAGLFLFFWVVVVPLMFGFLVFLA